MKKRANIINYRFAGLLNLIWMAMLQPVYPSGPDSLFQSDQLIRMELRADFAALQNDRDKIATYHDAVLICYSPSGDTTTFNVKLMIRGNFRRDPANCNFPPLYVNFRKKEVENTLFENQDKLKLVTPCHGEEDIIEEYLVYKLYNKVTDLSLKVRLVKVLYFDTGNGKEVFERFSFFLEHDEDAAERNNAFVKDRFITPFDLNVDNARKLSVFQYMVGNKDWQFTSRQNLILIQPNDTSLKPCAIPYDFDFSGFVNAHYTKPKGVPEDLLPTRRLYNGLCYTEREFREVLDYFIKLKPDFFSVINNMEYLSKARRREKISYLNAFYSVINDKEQFQKDFLDICQTKKDYGIIN
jgi:hypothetical protein